MPVEYHCPPGHSVWHVMRMLRDRYAASYMHIPDAIRTAEARKRWLVREGVCANPADVAWMAKPYCQKHMASCGCAFEEEALARNERCEMRIPRITFDNLGLASWASIITPDEIRAAWES